ncbi:MAG: hypothetical protein AAF911_05520 [Planctomycetota bacterium]
MHRIPLRTLAVMACVLAAWTATGCGTAPTIRISHAPTYSYLQDPEARAEIELWPAIPGEAGSLAGLDTGLPD